MALLCGYVLHNGFYSQDDGYGKWKKSVRKEDWLPELDANQLHEVIEALRRKKFKILIDCSTEEKTICSIFKTHKNFVADEASTIHDAVYGAISAFLCTDDHIVVPEYHI